ncbi:hypothetical protein [Lentzea sp. NEAU-D7]|uniref:hypothetical protein n=1 Tax=Lentzea sp. NEAU-D7 TaxID=2994667 RepID=UPI00224AC314|nr:hypothetical protein [Lentzea sp. NEAU-D7]MCX2954208.1 hypothetical protein [Lentzea sp. NEAU-D7]
MSRFEDNLWAELERDHGPALVQQSVNRRRANAGRWVAAAAAVAILLTGAMIAPDYLGGAPPSDALLDSDQDGSVTLKIQDIGRYDEVNAMLRERGIPAVMVPLRQDCADEVPQLDDTGRIGMIPWGAGSDSTKLVIVPSRIRQGATLVFATDQKNFGTVVSGLYARDRLPNCLLRVEAGR